MTRMSSVADSIPRPDVLDFLVRRAENGAALVFTEAIVTDYESAQGYPGPARLLTQRQIDTWKPVTAAIRHHGAVSLLHMICGKIHDRPTAQAALEHADIVLAAKSFLLNPNFVSDVREGRELPLYRSAEANVAYTEAPLP